MLREKERERERERHMANACMRTTVAQMILVDEVVALCLEL
jgi:hypothetical protein